MDAKNTHPLRNIRKEHNLSLVDLAEATQLSYRTLLRAEQGHPLRPESQRLLCEYFGKTSSELSLLPQQQLNSFSNLEMSNPTQLQATELEMLVAMQNLEKEGVNMSQSRRSFLKTLGTAGVSLVAASQELLHSPSLASTSKQHKHTLEASESTIVNLALVTQQHRTLQRSGFALEEALRSQIAVIQRTLEYTTNDKRRHGLWGILAQSQLIAGHSITKKEELGRARTWYESAMASAQYSEDALLVGATLGHLGHLHLRLLHNPLSARQLIERAQEHTGRHPVSGWFAMVLASIAAEEGKKWECENSLAKATEIVQRMPQTAEYNDLYFTDFNTAGVDAFVGNCLLKVGEPVKALERLTSMDVARLADHRQAAALHDIACAYAAHNEREAMQVYAFRSIQKALSTDRLYIIPRFLTLSSTIQKRDPHEPHAAAIAEYARFALQVRN